MLFLSLRLGSMMSLILPFPFKNLHNSLACISSPKLVMNTILLTFSFLCGLPIFVRRGTLTPLLLPSLKEVHPYTIYSAHQAFDAWKNCIFPEFCGGFDRWPLIMPFIPIHYIFKYPRLNQIPKQINKNLLSVVLPLPRLLSLGLLTPPCSNSSSSSLIW